MKTSNPKADLEVLYNKQELFTTEHGLSEARRNEFLSVIQICRALGGRWAEPAAPQTASVQTTM